MNPRILNPVSYTKHPRYDYVLDKDLVVWVPHDLGAHDFCDEFGNLWLEFRGHTMTVKKGYAWDGSSMSPDFPAVIAPSCVHDCLLQFRRVSCFPLSKCHCDDIFRDLMPSRFLLRWVYWGAVRAFGGAYAAATGGRDTSGSCGLPHRK